MKKLLVFFALFSFFQSFAQDYLGFVNSNYSGITGAILNPANIADSRLVVDVNLLGMNLNMANNYIGIKREALISRANAEKSFNDPQFQKKYLVDINNGKDKSVYFSDRISLLGFMISLGTKNAVGLSTNLRTYVNVDGVSEPLAKLMYSDIGRTTGYGAEDLIGKNFSNKLFSMNVMSWAECGLTFAHVFRDKDKHFFKVGITPKYLMGLASAFMNVEDFQYRFDNDAITVKNDSLQLLAVLKTHVNYGHSNNFDQLGSGEDFRPEDVLNSGESYPGWGLDIGAVYEWRPHFRDYKYDMDGKTDLWRKDKNKYKLRIGASLLDLGSIKYKKGRYSEDFYIDIDTIRYRILDLTDKPVLGFDRILDSLAVYKETPDTYNQSLPTALSIQIDYNIWKDFYVSLTPYFALQQKKRQAKVHDLTIITLAPRWDHKWFGVSIPVSYNSFYAKAEQPIKFGAMLRLGPIIVGTNDLASYTAGNLFGMNAYFLVKVPIPYSRPHDKDKDGVSNKKDKCRNEPGTWEFMGCPDRDHDHVQDKDDKCPDIAGLKEFAGCPDTDGDGIIDSEDNCPEDKGVIALKGCPDSDGDNVMDKEDDCPLVAGLAEFKGCPDADADGTEDKMDACPDVFGPKEYKGCPDRDADSIPDMDDGCPDQFGPKDNKGCPWPDADRDGVFDKEDDCPQVPGLPELKGCPKELPPPPSPISQTVAMAPKEKKIIEKAFATLEFATAKDVIKPKSYPALNDLAKLLVAHTADWKIKLAGHTDNEGNPEKNMILSEKRAKAVKNYLMKKGVKEEQVLTEWFGQTMPIADNKTPKGKQKNRRVEMKIQLKE